MTDQTIEQQSIEQESSDQSSSTSENAVEQDKKQKRLPKGSVPPALNLEEAVDIARKIYEMPGGEAPYAAAPDITGNSHTSSVFGKKTMALRDFGIAIADDKKKVIRLTELGQRIVAPRDEDEHLKALGESFLGIDLFAKVYERIKGRPLPLDQYLINTFSEMVPKELAAAWLEKLKRSIKTASLLDESRPDGKVYVLDRPQAAQTAKSADDAPPAVKEEKQRQAEESGDKSDVVRTPIPLGVGRLAHIELPRDWDKKEMKKLLKMLEIVLGDDDVMA